MRRRPARFLVSTLAWALLAVPAAQAQTPPEYQAVLTSLGRSGDFKDGVLKVNIPRSDLKVTIAQRPAATPFGFGGWVAFTKGTGGMDVMMGDLVLTEDEVNPVMSKLLDNGIDVTALHNHFFREQPRIFYMHVHGMGTAADLAGRLKPALALIPTPPAAAPGAPAGTARAGWTGRRRTRENHRPRRGTDRAGLQDHDRRVPTSISREHGAKINARMGLNTWAAFAGTDADAMVAGDVAMLAPEVTPVLKALRSHGIEVVAIHHHMTGTDPAVFFLHYYGTGAAAALAEGVRAAVAELGKAGAARR